jgi:hypothetical protein
LQFDLQLVRYKVTAASRGLPFNLVKAASMSSSALRPIASSSVGQQVGGGQKKAEGRMQKSENAILFE